MLFVLGSCEARTLLAGQMVAKRNENEGMKSGERFFLFPLGFQQEAACVHERHICIVNFFVVAEFALQFIHPLSSELSELTKGQTRFGALKS